MLPEIHSLLTLASIRFFSLSARARKKEQAEGLTEEENERSCVSFPFSGALLSLLPLARGKGKVNRCINLIWKVYLLSSPLGHTFLSKVNLS